MRFVVVDTNVLVGAILSKDGANREIIRRCLKKQISPVIGEKLFNEYEDLISRKDLFISSPLSMEERIEFFDAFMSCCSWVAVFFLWRPNLLDEGDNHVVELAVASGATMIITNNKKDFASGDLKFEYIKVLTPREYLNQEG